VGVLLSGTETLAAHHMAEQPQPPQSDAGFVTVEQHDGSEAAASSTMPAPSPQMPPPPRAAGGGGAPTTDALASFLAGSGITQSATVADVLRGEQVHDPGSFLALDADDVIELLATAKRKGVSVGDRAKLKALIRASGNTTVPETPRPSPRQPSQGIASLRAQFDAAPPEQVYEQPPPPPPPQPPRPPPSPARQPVFEDPGPPPVPAHGPASYSQHEQPSRPQQQWQQPPRTPYPAAQHSPPPAPGPAPSPPPRDHGQWVPEPPAAAPAPAPAPAPVPRSPFRNPFASAGFAQAQGFFEAMMVMLGPIRSGAADFIDAMALKYVRPVLAGRGFEAFGYSGSPLANAGRHSWINSAMPRLLLFYGIFRGFVAMTTRVDSMMAFFIGFFLRRRDNIGPPPPPQQPAPAAHQQHQPPPPPHGGYSGGQDI
jgi:hypothetical protein